MDASILSPSDSQKTFSLNNSLAKLDTLAHVHIVVVGQPLYLVCGLHLCGGQ